MYEYVNKTEPAKTQNLLLDAGKQKAEGANCGESREIPESLPETEFLRRVPAHLFNGIKVRKLSKGAR